jgi:hypothetical protein
VNGEDDYDVELHERAREREVGGLVPEDLTPAAPADRRQQAAIAKAQFEAFVKGANARAEMLPRTDLAKLGFGVAHRMLSEVITGRVQPKSAKEAMDVAKAAMDIARRETGEGDTQVIIRTPEDRARAVASIAELRAVARARQIEGAQADIEEIEDAEVIEDTDADIVAGTLAGLVPRSTEGAAVLSRVRAVRADQG